MVSNLYFVTFIKVQFVPVSKVRMRPQSPTLNLGRELTKFTERHTPGSNLWYSRLLVQRLWWDNMLRLLDDDADQTFRRSEQAAERWGYGDYWWRPGELTP